MKQSMYRKPADTKDLRESGRVILAHGEVTGHNHQVYADVDSDVLSTAQYFEEPDGRRVLLCVEPCVLRHQEHAPITLDPAQPIQARQGDVLLNPIGPGAWEVIRQREFSPAKVYQVAD